MINPYNFVRPDKAADLRRPHDHAHMGGRSGLFACRLETVTPIFTPASTFRSPGTQANLSFFRVANRPAIPGSSLKGTVRSLAEAIANGCSPFDSRIHPRCRSVDNLCPCCRLFGYLKGGSVHTGQVSISDALAEDGYEIGQRVTLKELGSPKSERHTPFYGGAGQNRERKFYYHQQQVQRANDIPAESNPTHRNVRIEPLLRGEFRFSIRYWNLNDVELGLLLHTLELPPGLFHKVGMGKPLGLGTVRVGIVGWKESVTDPADLAWRYRHLGQASFDVMLDRQQDEETLTAAKALLQERIATLKRVYAHHYSQVLGVPTNDDLWALSAKNLEDLKIILSLVSYSEEIRYPGYAWFRDPEEKEGRRNADRPLPSVQQVHAGKRLLD